MRASFQPKLQTRCSGETGGITRLELETEIYIVTASVHRCFLVMTAGPFDN